MKISDLIHIEDQPIVALERASINEDELKNLVVELKNNVVLYVEAIEKNNLFDENKFKADLILFTSENFKKIKDSKANIPKEFCIVNEVLNQLNNVEKSQFFGIALGVLKNHFTNESKNNKAFIDDKISKFFIPEDQIKKSKNFLKMFDEALENLFQKNAGINSNSRAEEVRKINKISDENEKNLFIRYLKLILEELPKKSGDFVIKKDQDFDKIPNPHCQNSKLITDVISASQPDK